MGAAEMKAGHEEENANGTSAAPWPLLDGVRHKTSPSLTMIEVKTDINQL